MTELERALLAVGRELDFPPQPDLAAAVRARLEKRRFRWRSALFAAAALFVAIGIAMAVPPARSAILRLLHIGAVTVERVDTLPAARERPLVAGLGPPLARRAAEIHAQLPLTLPDLRGPAAPARYYAKPGLIATVLLYRGTPILLAEMPNEQVGLFKKFASPATRVDQVALGRFGLWFEGGKHVLMWNFGPGDIQEVETRLAGNVLVWYDGERTFRLEGDLDKDGMLQLARRIGR
jgi:hypothetical protein